MNQISNNLWIGSIEDVSEEETENFDYVVSVCQDERGENVGCEYIHFPLADDEESAEKWGGSTDYGVFEAAARKVEELLEEEETVLIHCHRGRNRSVAVGGAALTLVSKGPLGFKDILLWMKQKREIADPNELMQSHAREYVRVRMDEIRSND